MIPNYFDFHSHLHFDAYAEDREAVLERMKENNVWTIVVGTDEEKSKKALALAQAHDGVFATVGLHPCLPAGTAADNKEESFDETFYEELLSDENVLMIGECGLDYFHIKEKDKQVRQMKEFEKQIDFAVHFNKPMMLHVRGAHEDALDMLRSKKKEYGDRLRGNVHFFTGEPEIAKQYYELDFTTSFTGVVTFTRDYDEAVKYAPKDMILSDTDSPYVAPVPYRGQRNEPTYVIEVVKRLAEIRGEDLEEFKKQLIKNTSRFVPQLA